MSKTIDVPLPVNVSEEDRYLFEPFTQYTLPDLAVLDVEDIFVSYSGLCVDKRGLMKECHHAYPEKFNQTIQEAMRHFNEARADKSNLIRTNEDEVCLLIHHPFSANYWHWITEAIPRLWAVRDRLESLVLIMPQTLWNKEFVQGTLASFEFKNILFVPSNKSLWVKRLCLPQIKHFSDSYDKQVMLSIRNHYLSEAQYYEKSSERIYLSRRKSARRRVVNEDQIIPILQDNGFVMTYNEDLTFMQQVALHSQAKFLISVHGAGLTNMLFMKPSSAVFEFHKKIMKATDWHSFAFWYLCESLDFRYFQQLCEPVDPDEHFFDASLMINTKLFEKNLKIMLKDQVS
jgi:capsular polysaccharide biosynthesis protein